MADLVDEDALCTGAGANDREESQECTRKDARAEVEADFEVDFFEIGSNEG